MAGKRTPEEHREYMKKWREAKSEDPKSENTISDKGEEPGIYNGKNWDGVIGGMTQEARDAILTRMNKKADR